MMKEVRHFLKLTWQFLQQQVRVELARHPMNQVG
jgi:hypothetical protein